MTEYIWVVGPSAIGKQTFIRKVMEDEGPLRRELGLSMESGSVVARGSAPFPPGLSARNSYEFMYEVGPAPLCSHGHPVPCNRRTKFFGKRIPQQNCRSH